MKNHSLRLDLNPRLETQTSSTLTTRPWRFVWYTRLNVSSFVFWQFVAFDIGVLQQSKASARDHPARWPKSIFHSFSKKLSKPFGIQISLPRIFILHSTSTGAGKQAEQFNKKWQVHRHTSQMYVIAYAKVYRGFYTLPLAPTTFWSSLPPSCCWRASSFSSASWSCRHVA